MNAQAIGEQYERAWQMATEIIPAFSAGQWKAGARPALVPARWAHHLVETVDFYRRPSPEGFPWGSRFGVDWEGPPESQPDQEQLLTYMADVRAALRDWLSTATEADLAGPNAFPWTGRTVADRLLYALRHTMYHLGELSMLLRLHGAEETPWR